MVEEDEGKASLLNAFFSSVFIQENRMTDEIIRDNVNSPINVTCLIGSAAPP